MSYRPRTPPAEWDPQWFAQEQANIAAALVNPEVETLTFKTAYAAPGRIYPNITLAADGTTWNPGSGAGVYTWYAGSWKKLG